jgi:hypothetical protein
VFEPKTLSEEMLLSVVRVEADVDGNVLPATGFLYRFDVPGRPLAVVTNKHVRADAAALRIFFHLGHPKGETTAEPTGTIHAAEVGPTSPAWLDHPDPSIDLCAWLCDEPVARVEGESGLRVFQRAFDSSVLASDTQLEDFSAAEDALMIGYPDGIWDTTHNLPLLRRGLTATHPSIDFCGRPEGILDIAAIGGSSGSPIVLLSEGAHLSRKPKEGQALLTPGDRLVLLGIASNQVVVDVEGRIEKRAVPIRRKESYAVTSVQAHLAFYVRAKELLVLEKQIEARHQA